MVTTGEQDRGNIHIVIVAAGTGSRFGSDLPKQFCELAGRPVLMHTIESLRAAVPEGRVTVVLSAAMQGMWEEMCAERGFESPAVTTGGATRWHSVKNALESIDAKKGDVIMVHDGARPVVDAAMCARLIEEARRSGAAIPAMALSESIREVDATGASHAADRSRFRSVQTPQAFEAETLTNAYGRPREETFTDDASVVEAAGGTVSLVEGSARNIKITYPDDIKIAEIYLKERH